MGRKGNLAIFESNSISETGKVTPTKIGVYACDINLYLHEFFGPIRSINFFDDHGLYSPWVEREIWPFLRVTVSPKPERSRPPKLVCMHVTSIFTCMNFLGRFRSIKFFDDHGL